MSKQNKMARKQQIAKQFKGRKGPSRTTPKHGKVNTWYNSSSSTYWRKPKLVKGERDQNEAEGKEFFKKMKAYQTKMAKLAGERAES